LSGQAVKPLASALPGGATQTLTLQSAISTTFWFPLHPFSRGRRKFSPLIPMPAGSASTSLSITNPLVLYRTLIATKKIKPDPAQHRLALQLQKLYFRLKDYSPEIEYRHRLEQISRSISGGRRHAGQARRPRTSPTRSGLLSTLFQDAAGKPIRALTRTVPIHDSALSIGSPHGMLLYGEVGRGKSMLLDLLYSSLPSEKKKRWHFNTFMLDMFRRLELARIERSELVDLEHEHVVLSLAKDTVTTSPILFLDEFQMPDRASSKLLNGFMTAFFHLGGVLVANSNRMPDELAKASGIEFGSRARRSSGQRGVLGWSFARVYEGEKAAQSDFGLFLEVLKARCEIWEMEGERDWRREEDDEYQTDDVSDEDGHALSNVELGDPDPSESLPVEDIKDDARLTSDCPRHYHITLASDQSADPGFTKDLLSLNPTQRWTPKDLHVYGRTLHLSDTHHGVVLATFPSLCATHLGPADYVSICSTFHTLILTDIPVLTLQQKNEARRFITLLDALYESRCRLLITAAAPPDRLFFPETRMKWVAAAHDSTSTGGGVESDSIESEAFSEMYQDSTAPFRPNVSSYAPDQPYAWESASPHAFTPSPSSHPARSVLADEDADFGPTYGNGRSHGMSTMDSGPAGMAELERRQGPDFTDTRALTGEDEKFAYKRARSRLWEMCGRRWWMERQRARNVDDWWRPVDRPGRHWETLGVDKGGERTAPPLQEARQAGRKVDNELSSNGMSTAAQENGPLRHDASPHRRRTDAPPKFGWQHAWGMMKWGKGAGEWGQGVEGDRKRQRQRQRQNEESDEAQNT